MDNECSNFYVVNHYSASGTGAAIPPADNAMRKQADCSVQGHLPPLSVRFRAPSLWGHSSHLLKSNRNNEVSMVPGKGWGTEMFSCSTWLDYVG